MLASLLVVWGVFGAAISQQLISPCPKIFQYEKRPEEPDRWYGTAVLTGSQDLVGVWFRVVLDSTALQLGNWFGEVETKDHNKGFLVKNPDYRLKAGTPLTIKFFVRFDPNRPPPKLVSLRLNAVVKCPEDGVVTEAPWAAGHLFTNQPDLSDPSSPDFGSSPSINIRPPGRRPGSSDDEDFYHSDFGALSLPDSGRPQAKPSLLAKATCGTVVKSPRPLITHGQAIGDGDFPWHAALYHAQGIDLTYTCGASLISLQHLLTVAHCVTRKKSTNSINAGNLLVYLGKFYLRIWKTPGIQDKRVDSITVHPKYNPHTFGNDVAVVKLAEPAELTNYVRPICLWEGNSKLDLLVDQLGTVVGWGFDESGKITEQLTKANMPIVSQETCIYSFPDFYSRFTSNTTFCAGFKNGTSACNGDSGGGMVFPRPGSDKTNPVWQIRGLVSISVALQNGFKCDSSHYTVFTDVAKFLDFIKGAMTDIL
uniref:Peptidase S1 domain-containing protein n=1 Tax=Dendroctonus ponderosae TaxID=77166 RepID=A0AAR5PRL4_DENPD